MKNLFQLIYLGVALSHLVLFSFNRASFNCRRLRATLSLSDGLIENNIAFEEIFRDIRDGQRSSYSRTINSSNVRIEIYGQHLAPASDRGELSGETVFLTIKVFNYQNDILAYSVVYPTQYGYALAYSQRANADIGSLAESIMIKAKEAFGLEPKISYMQELGILPKSAQILGSYLSSYFYEKYLYTSSHLEAFVSTVDSLRQAITEFSLGNMPDVDTIASRLKTVYLKPSGKSKELSEEELLKLSRELSDHFNSYYFYYHFIKNYPNGTSRLRSDLEQEIVGCRLIEQAEDRCVAYLQQYLEQEALRFKGVRIPKATALAPIFRGLIEDLGINLRQIETSQEQ